MMIQEPAMQACGQNGWLGGGHPPGRMAGWVVVTHQAVVVPCHTRMLEAQQPHVRPQRGQQPLHATRPGASTVIATDLESAPAAAARCDGRTRCRTAMGGLPAGAPAVGSASRKHQSPCCHRRTGRTWCLRAVGRAAGSHGGCSVCTGGAWARGLRPAHAPTAPRWSRAGPHAAIVLPCCQ